MYARRHSPSKSASKSADWRRIGWRAWFATAMAVIVGLAPVLGTLHRALVRHQLCEHGDLIELPDQQQALRGADRVDEGARAAAIAQAAGASAHQHDHCTVGALGRSAAAPAREPDFHGLASEKSCISPAESERTFSRWILSLAPKTSPPVAS